MGMDMDMDKDMETDPGHEADMGIDKVMDILIIFFFFRYRTALI